MLPLLRKGRMGIMGGTFDPVHHGHLSVVRTVCRDMALNRLLFIPAFLPPHKPGRDISAFADRAAMLELAVRDDARFFVSRMEAQRGGPSYSIDTLRLLSAFYGPDVALFFIVGMDAFTGIATWKEHAGLLDYASLVVVGRPDQTPATCGQTIFLSFPGYAYDVNTGCWQGPQPGSIYQVAMAPVPVSSSRIRENVRLGHSIADLVPEPVASYIFAHGLYGAPTREG